MWVYKMQRRDRSEIKIGIRERRAFHAQRTVRAGFKISHFAKTQVPFARDLLRGWFSTYLPTRPYQTWRRSPFFFGWQLDRPNKVWRRFGRISETTYRATRVIIPSRARSSAVATSGQAGLKIRRNWIEAIQALRATFSCDGRFTVRHEAEANMRYPVAPYRSALAAAAGYQAAFTSSTKPTTACQSRSA